MGFTQGSFRSPVAGSARSSAPAPGALRRAPRALGRAGVGCTTGPEGSKARKAEGPFSFSGSNFCGAAPESGAVPPGGRAGSEMTELWHSWSFEDSLRGGSWQEWSDSGARYMESCPCSCMIWLVGWCCCFSSCDNASMYVAMADGSSVSKLQLLLCKSSRTMLDLTRPDPSLLGLRICRTQTHKQVHGLFDVSGSSCSRGVLGWIVPPCPQRSSRRIGVGSREAVNEP